MSWPEASCPSESKNVFVLNFGPCKNMPVNFDPPKSLGSLLWGDYQEYVPLCVATTFFFYSKMHTIEGLKLVLYRISIENNEKYCHAQIKVFDTF